MNSLHERLRGPTWGLSRSISAAEEVASNPRLIRPVIAALFADEAELRKRAADVARRLTDHHSDLLRLYADELAGLLESLPPEESRTRWHLGLVVPRIAHTRIQRLRAARIMLLLAEDQSNVVRCSAVQGLGLLALAEPSLIEDAEIMIEQFLRHGTPAMKCRARHAEQKLKHAKPAEG